VTFTLVGSGKGRVIESGRGLEDDDVRVLLVNRALALILRIQGKISYVGPDVSMENGLMLSAQRPP
jgi:hypothetical protein